MSFRTHKVDDDDKKRFLAASSFPHPLRVKARRLGLLDANDHGTGLSADFQCASIARSAKRTNEGFVLIATTVSSLEVLATISQLGPQYSGAKRRGRTYD